MPLATLDEIATLFQQYCTRDQIPQLEVKDGKRHLTTLNGHRLTVLAVPHSEDYPGLSPSTEIHKYDIPPTALDPLAFLRSILSPQEAQEKQIAIYFPPKYNGR